MRPIGIGNKNGSSSILHYVTVNMLLHNTFYGLYPNIEHLMKSTIKAEFKKMNWSMQLANSSLFKILIQ